MNAAIGIDWISGTIPYPDDSDPADLAATISELISIFFPEKRDYCDAQSFGQRGYDTSLSWFGGAIKICWHSQKPSQRLFCAFSGSACESLPLDCQFALLQALSGFGFRASRLDLYFRDFSRKLSPADLHEAALAGYLRRFKHSNFSYVSSGFPDASGATASTFYAGSRQSEIFFRCYDERFEARSPLDCIKFEAQWQSTKAANLQAFLLERGFDDLPRLILSKVVGPSVLDFRCGDASQRLEIQEQCAFWADFLSSLDQQLDATKIAGKHKPMRCYFPLEHFARQWGRSLARLNLSGKRELFDPLDRAISYSINIGKSSLEKRGDTAFLALPVI